MSWNKNTVVCSEVDTIVRILQEVGMAYELTVLGKVRGRGLNDDYGGAIGLGEDGCYEMRRLAYGNKIVMESIFRTDDCDADDVISSTIFLQELEPEDWELEVFEH